MKRELQRFVRLSHLIGKDLCQSQAAGGNFSIKLDDHRMMIKNSGVRLRDVRATIGWTLMDFNRLEKSIRHIRRDVRAATAREIAYADGVRDASLSSDRPSMEAGFHAAIAERYVFHVHSVAGLVLSLLGPRQAAPWLRRYRRAPVLQWVASRLPGMELSWDIYDRASRRSPGTGVTLWLLTKHGVIWSGNDWKKLMDAMQSFERHFQSVWHFADYSPGHAQGRRGCRQAPITLPRQKDPSLHLCFCHWPNAQFILRPLFPDLIIYFNLLSPRPDVIKTSRCSVLLRGRDVAQLSDKAEVFYSHALASSVLAALGGHARPLGRSLIHRIKNLETERARMKLIAASRREKVAP